MDQITVALLLKLVRLLVGIGGFTGLLWLDVWKAWKSKALWVPAGALVLSAFSLQLLDLLDNDDVSIADYPEIQEYELKKVLRNGLLVDGGRVMVCVYMGYLLPEMARSPSKRVVWNDIGALALSVFTNIFSELYVFVELYSKLGEGLRSRSQEYNAPSPSPDEYIAVNPLSIASRLCTMVSIVLLFFLLSSAAFAGKTLHNLVKEKIPLVLKEEPTDHEPERVKEYVFRSWVVAWVCKPDYIITRSVLASSVGVVVTLSVGCFAAECITQDYKVLHFDDGIDWFRYTVTAFLILLILIGWSIILFRWMFSVYYFPRKYRIPNKGYFHVEDFWIRHISEVTDHIKYSGAPWYKSVSGGGFIESFQLRILKTIKAYVFLRPLLFRLQKLVVLSSKLCFFLCDKMMFLDKTRWLMVGQADPDFACYKKALEEVKMPGEAPRYLFAASLKALKQTKRFREKGRIEGAKSERLIELLRAHSTQHNSEGKLFLGNLRDRLSRGGVPFAYLKMFSWKMTALSLIQVLLELDDREKDAVLDAYSQACVFLDLLDNISGSDSEKTADKHFEDIKKEKTADKASEIGTVEQARLKVESLGLRASERATSFDPSDSADWWDIATNNSLEKVCTVILEDDPNPDTSPSIDMMNKVRRLLADMLHIALKEEVGRALVKKCREWAGMLEDEKIRASVYIAGKLSGVIEELDKPTSSPKASAGEEDGDGCCGCCNCFVQNEKKKLQV